MPLVKAAKPKEIFAAQDWAAITGVSRWYGLWLVLHAWLIALLVAGGTTLLWQWNWIAGAAATPFALILIGSRQLGLAVLMHEAAHGTLHANRRINNFLGQWPAGAATGSDLQAYRAYHLTHHKYTQQAEDPDLALSAPFPTTLASMRRKIIRDLTAQTFFKQRSHQFIKALEGLKAMLSGKEEAPAQSKLRDTSAGTMLNRSSRAGIGNDTEDMNGAKVTARTVGRFLCVQLIVLAASLAAFGLSWGWLPFFLWVAALMTTFQMILRIRNIAEHACTATGSDDPFTHARTTRANWLERATLAPYWVNFHAEHHLFMAVPCYRLAKAHQLLCANGFEQRLTIAPSYRSVMTTITAS